MRMVCVGLTLIGLFVSPGLAEAQKRVTAAELSSNVANLLGHDLRIGKIGCFVAEDGRFKCTTYTGVYIAPRDVAPASLKAKIKAECGGLVEMEDDPSCLFDGVFTPSSMERGRGQVTRGDRSVESDVLILNSPPITLTPHR